MAPAFQILLLFMLGCMLGTSLQAREPGSTGDHRARIVESTLRDLSRTTDAANSRQAIEIGRSSDAMGAPIVSLKPQEVPGTKKLVAQDIQSSLHRLYRDTANRQISDGRKARVEESLSRMAEEDTPDQPEPP